MVSGCHSGTVRPCIIMPHAITRHWSSPLFIQNFRGATSLFSVQRGWLTADCGFYLACGLWLSFDINLRDEYGACKWYRKRTPFFVSETLAWLHQGNGNMCERWYNYKYKLKLTEIVSNMCCILNRIFIMHMQDKENVLFLHEFDVI